MGGNLGECTIDPGGGGPGRRAELRHAGLSRLCAAVVLTLVYTLNFIDRNLLGVVAQPIIAEFGLTDTEYGFLNGPRSRCSTR